MARPWLTLLTAAVLVVLALALFLGRRWVLGDDIDGPYGASAWRVTFTATGEPANDQASLTVTLPPDFRRQHIVDDRLPRSVRLVRGKEAGRQEVVWRLAGPAGAQPVRLTWSFRCLLDVRRPTPSMRQITRELDAAPARGEAVKPSRRIESDHKEITETAHGLVSPEMAPIDQVHALFDYVDQRIETDPIPEVQSALECLRASGGNPGGKSRLLAALCRNRGIPARLAAGLVLVGEQEQSLHYWAEAWVNDHWLPMDPTYHHFGPLRFPHNYLVLHLSDDEPLRGQGLRFQYGIRVQPLRDPFVEADGDEPPSRTKRLWLRLSLSSLRPAEQHLVKFLLLLPLSALIVSVFRVVIGVPTFGTFGPALLGLVFLDWTSLPWGLGIFLFIVLAGWLLRHLLDRYRLLWVPRSAALLTLIIILILVILVGASYYQLPVTQYIALFPLVILTHLVERFWTVEAEDGTAASFRTLLGTVVVAVTVSLLLAPAWVGNWMFRHPETLGPVLAAMLLLGRYTGYRVSELRRFRDLLGELTPGGPG